MDKIIDNNCTDKNTVHSYLNTYEKLLEKYKNKKNNILEIGIGSGGSIKLWNDYFPNSMIYSVDIEDRILCKEIKNMERIKLFIPSNAYDKNFIKSNFRNKNIIFNIIIDDGPHTLESMINCIELYLELLSDDGILIIEDVKSLEWCEILKNKIPSELKKNIKIFDLRKNKNRFDDILFTVTK
jgi:cephalosporin hydroxylase